MTHPDPFAGGTSAPSLSFKNLPFGTRYLCTVTALPELVHGTDFETKEKAYWPADASGARNPKMSAVVNVDIGGQPFSVWAAKPSALFSAIAEAQTAAGRQIEVGGVLDITYTHDTPAKGGAHLNPAKQFTVVYTPPANAGAFATEPAPATPPPPAAAPIPQVTPVPAAQPVAAAPSPAPAGMTAEQAAALRAAGLDPATVAAAQTVAAAGLT
jgi:hypothetical protein